MERCSICGKPINLVKDGYLLTEQLPESVVCEECIGQIRRIPSLAKNGDRAFEDEVNSLENKINGTDVSDDVIRYLGSYLSKHINRYNAAAFGTQERGSQSEQAEVFRTINKHSKKNTIYLQRAVAFILVFVSLMGLFLPWMKIKGTGEIYKNMSLGLMFAGFGDDLINMAFGSDTVSLIVQGIRMTALEEFGVFLDQEKIERDFTTLQNTIKDGQFSPMELKDILNIFSGYLRYIEEDADVSTIKAVAYVYRIYLDIVILFGILAMISILMNRRKIMLIVSMILTSILPILWIVAIAISNSKADEYLDEGPATAVGIGIFVTLLSIIAAVILYRQNPSKPVVKLVQIKHWIVGASRETRRGAVSVASKAKVGFLRRQYLSHDWNCTRCRTGNTSEDRYCRRCGAKRPDVPRCKKCGKVFLTEGFDYCDRCGTKNEALSACPVCGHYLERGSAFCTYCGRQAD